MKRRRVTITQNKNIKIVFFFSFFDVEPLKLTCTFTFYIHMLNFRIYFYGTAALWSIYIWIQKGLAWGGASVPKRLIDNNFFYAQRTHQISKYNIVRNHNTQPSALTSTRRLKLRRRAVCRLTD